MYLSQNLFFFLVRVPDTLDDPPLPTTLIRPQQIVIVIRCYILIGLFDLKIMGETVSASIEFGSTGDPKLHNPNIVINVQNGSGCKISYLRSMEIVADSPEIRVCMSTNAEKYAD